MNAVVHDIRAHFTTAYDRATRRYGPEELIAAQRLSTAVSALNEAKSDKEAREARKAVSAARRAVTWGTWPEVRDRTGAVLTLTSEVSMAFAGIGAVVAFARAVAAGIVS